MQLKEIREIADKVYSAQKRMTSKLSVKQVITLPIKISNSELQVHTLLEEMIDDSFNIGIKVESDNLYIGSKVKFTIESLIHAFTVITDVVEYLEVFGEEDIFITINNESVTINFDESKFKAEPTQLKEFWDPQIIKAGKYFSFLVKFYQKMQAGNIVLDKANRKTVEKLAERFEPNDLNECEVMMLDKQNDSTFIFRHTMIAGEPRFLSMSGKTTNVKIEVTPSNYRDLIALIGKIEDVFKQDWFYTIDEIGGKKFFNPIALDLTNEAKVETFDKGTETYTTDEFIEKFTIKDTNWINFLETNILSFHQQKLYDFLTPKEANFIDCNTIQFNCNYYLEKHKSTNKCFYELRYIMNNITFKVYFNKVELAKENVSILGTFIEGNLKLYQKVDKKLNKLGKSLIVEFGSDRDVFELDGKSYNDIKDVKKQLKIWF